MSYLQISLRGVERIRQVVWVYQRYHIPFCELWWFCGTISFNFICDGLRWKVCPKSVSCSDRLTCSTQCSPNSPRSDLKFDRKLLQDVAKLWNGSRYLFRVYPDSLHQFIWIHQNGLKLVYIGLQKQTHFTQATCEAWIRSGVPHRRVWCDAGVKQNDKHGGTVGTKVMNLID